jgi:hypothetical protein
MVAMRKVRHVPGLDWVMFPRSGPLDSLRELGHQCGTFDAAAGAFASPEYVAFAVSRLGRPEWTREEQHEFVVGLVEGLDAARRS